MGVAGRYNLTIKSLFSDLLDLLYPPLCQVCKRTFSGDNIWLCDDCRRNLQKYQFPICPICRVQQQQPVHTCRHCRRRPNIAWLYSLGPYDECYSSLVKAVKYLPKPELGNLLGSMVAAELAELPHIKTIEAICAVPLYYRKQAKRGFNQSEILASRIAESLQIEYFPEQLVQVRKNRDQIGLTIEERFQNVQDVYEIAGDFQLAAKSVLLVDDVTTSGATLNAAALALKQGGAGHVAAATVAVAFEQGINPAAVSHYLAERLK